jgi:choline dehydrogenase-like flavoprotein
MRHAGKALGGGSVINYCGWTRGDVGEYGDWARVVGDDRWSFKGLLPYFRGSEHYFDSKADPEIHGSDGPIILTLSKQVTLGESMGFANLSGWLGVRLGSVRMLNPPQDLELGLMTWLENWHYGKRQPANLAYGLEGVRVVTKAIVHRVVFSKDNAGSQVATAALRSDGRRFIARKEIILSTRVFRTPQILILSGIGQKRRYLNTTAL